MLHIGSAERKTAPVKGPLDLVPIAVTAFDDHRPVAAISIPAAIPVPTAMKAAVVVAELGACTAEIVPVTELTTIPIAADANANTKFLGAGYGGRRNRNSRQGCERKTKLSHVPSSRSCPRENGGTESLFLEETRRFDGTDIHAADNVARILRPRSPVCLSTDPTTRYSSSDVSANRGRPYVAGGPLLRRLETAVTSCAGANGLFKRMLFGTP
jgi:hypothetical protein